MTSTQQHIIHVKTFSPNIQKRMGGIVIQLNSHINPTSFFSTSHNSISKHSLKSTNPPTHLCFTRINKIRANVETLNATPAAEDENPAVDFAFVHSVLLPDGTPDVHYRTANGGQKLRDIMLDHDIELYGPYARPLLNCAGGGTCGTCLVEVVQGKELLGARTEKEKEKLKRRPKNWRLACQATVGKADSRGLVVIQQLPEWKAHEWTYGKEIPEGQTVETI
ncbi:Photosynthetic NDH subunit of subcomplex B 3, chloroplastic [Castilleja foliolosa]|uniref:Photosynthetic NDH subunit of subcomplex B 3, chloroplastic n=1 Tax=Castilleja foliolosa TaxID=1961234 RepID=A0ABD3CPN8_9LAMI